MAFKETASEWKQYRAMKKSHIRKNPVMDTWLGTDQEDIDRWDRRADATISELDDLAPHASIVLGMGHVDVIWYLDQETELRYLMEMGLDSSELADDGYHPGLFICPDESGFRVSSTCYFEKDRIFDEYGRGQIITADELKDLIRKIESEYSGHFLAPRGKPVNYRR